jgi:hypothetical protein
MRRIHIVYLQHHIQMLEFCRDTLQDLSNFEADGVSRIHHTEIAVADVFSHIQGVANRHRRFCAMENRAD